MANGRISAGFGYCFYARVDEDGIIVGTDGNAPVAGNQDGVGAIRLEGAKTVPVGIPDSEVVTATGDDQALVAFQFDPASLPSGVLETAVRDEDFEATAQGTKVQDYGDLSLGVLQPRDSDRPDLMWLFQRRAKTWESGNRGNSAWEIAYAPVTVVTPRFNQFEERATNGYPYSISLSTAGKFAWGATITEANNGTTGAPLVAINSDNPIHIKRFTGDNSETIFNLDYSPISDAKTRVFIDGVLQSASGYAIDAAAKTLTFTGAPTTAATIVVLYEVLAKDLS